MISYSKYSCPKCKSTLEDWHHTYKAFGNPFIKCKVCGSLVKVSNVTEWEVMSSSQQLVFAIPFYFQSLLIGGMIALFIGLFLNIKENFILIVFITVGIVMGFIWRHITFRQLVNESLARTKDPNYRKLFEKD